MPLMTVDLSGQPKSAISLHWLSRNLKHSRAAFNSAFFNSAQIHHKVTLLALKHCNPYSLGLF